MIKNILIIIITGALLISCDRVVQEIETEIITEQIDYDIAGFIGYNCCYSDSGFPDFLYNQEVRIHGIDSRDSVTIILNQNTMSEQYTLSGRLWNDYFAVFPGDTCNFLIRINEKTAKFSDIMPACFTGVDCWYNDYISVTKYDSSGFMILQTYTKNADYLLYDIFMTDNGIVIADTTFSNYDFKGSLAFIPPVYFNENYETYIYIYAISGLQPGITQESNLEGDLKGKIYLYTKVMNHCISKEKRELNKGNINFEMIQKQSECRLIEYILNTREVQ